MKTDIVIQTRRVGFGSVTLAKSKMAYFIVSFLLFSAFISVGRCCSCLPSHPQNEYCNSAFGEYTLNFLKQHSNLVVQPFMPENPLLSQQVLFNCSVVVFLTFMPTCSKLLEINEILSNQTTFRPAASHDETRDERNSFVETYKDVKVSMKSLIRVYYFQRLIACGIQ